MVTTDERRKMATDLWARLKAAGSEKRVVSLLAEALRKSHTAGFDASEHSSYEKAHVILERLGRKMDDRAEGKADDQ